MPQNKEAIGQATWKRLSEFKIDPTPEHYELFYRAIEGENKALVHDFHVAEKAGRLNHNDVLEGLHIKHVAPQKMASTMLEVGNKLSVSMEHIRGITQTVAKDHDAFGEAMSTLSDLLNGTSDPNKIIAAVSQIATASRAMQRKSVTSSGLLKKMVVEIQDLRQKIEEVQQDALTDQLTGVGNRRMFERVFDEEWKKAISTGSALSLVMADVDHFKAFNDKWGHPTGDAALRNIGKLLHARVEGLGTVCRYGGEEFVIILPGIASMDAMPIMDEIRRELARIPLVRKDSKTIIGNISASFGVAGLQSGESKEQLLSRADKSLYQAKEKGRNRVIGDLAADSDVGPVISRVKEALQSVTPKP